MSSGDFARPNERSAELRSSLVAAWSASWTIVSYYEILI